MVVRLLRINYVADYDIEPIPFYCSTVPSYLADQLSLRLVGAVGARINVRGSLS